MLVCYARELKEAFAEYSEEVVKIMVPLLKFYFHDGILVHLGEREGREKGSARSKLLPPLRGRCLPRVSVLAGGDPWWQGSFSAASARVIDKKKKKKKQRLVNSQSDCSDQRRVADQQQTPSTFPITMKKMLVASSL